MSSYPASSSLIASYYPTDGLVTGEQHASVHAVYSCGAAGQPVLPAGGTAAQLHQCDAQERRRPALDGDRGQQGRSPPGPQSQCVWAVTALC